MLNMDILTSYSFIIVGSGTFLLAAIAGAVGCITVLKGQSLIGDAIGHAAFPGIILSFMLFMQREPVLLTLGAVASGATAFMLIQVIKENSKLKLDAILAVVLSSFFGVGMVLKSYIQGNSNYKDAAQSGLSSYIFGQAAYIVKDDVKLIVYIGVPTLLLLVLFYKEIKLFLFDEIYAKTIGIRTVLLYVIILVMTMGIIAAGLKLVGAILISSLLIIPAITALQWSDKFSRVLIIAGIVGGVSALIGTYISTAFNGMSTGATIILIMGSFAIISLVIGPHGMIKNLRMRRHGGNDCVINILLCHILRVLLCTSYNSRSLCGVKPVFGLKEAFNGFRCHFTFCFTGHSYCIFHSKGCGFSVFNSGSGDIWRDYSICGRIPFGDRPCKK